MEILQAFAEGMEGFTEVNFTFDFMEASMEDKDDMEA